MSKSRNSKQEGAAAEARASGPVLSVDQIHARAIGALADAELRNVQVEAAVVGIKRKGDRAVLALAGLNGSDRFCPTLDATLRPRALRDLETAIGGPLADTSLRGWNILAEVHVALSREGRLRTTVLAVRRIEPSLQLCAAVDSFVALREEGLIERQKLLPVPGVIRTVAVICPEGSNARADVAKVLGRMYGGWVVEVVWLYDDIDGLFAKSFEAQMAAIFGPQALKKIPNNHAIYHSFFKFDKGPPTTSFELNGWGDDLVHDYLKAIEINGRIAVLYSNKDYGCEWDYDFKNKRFLSEDNTKFGVNIIMYALNS